MANGSSRLFGLCDFTDEVDNRTVVGFAFLRCLLITKTVHAVATDEEESDIILQFDSINVLVDTYGIMAFVALKLQHVLFPEPRNELHLESFLGKPFLLVLHLQFIIVTGRRSQNGWLVQ